MRTSILIGSALALSAPLATAADSTYSKRMQDAIVRELQRHPAFDMDDVQVRVEDAHAELVGSVDSLVAKRRAEWLAAEVRGVEVVDNDLVVSGSERPDDALRQAVLDALGANPVAERSGITVSVRDGEVVLTGSVASWQERQMAGLAVMEVDGVTTIDNRLRIADTAATGLDDERLASAIREAIRSRDEFDAERLQVQVDTGTVRISGRLPSLAARYRLRSLAWRPGVDRVILDEVDVRPQARSAIIDDEPADSTAGPSDATVRERVSTALADDPQINQDSITVTVDGGSVQLDGSVDTLHQQVLAARLAQTIDGVDAVDNQVAVDPPQERSDETIASSVRDAFQRDTWLHRDGITVQVSDGVVGLEGAVDNSWEAQRAREIAGRVLGVQAVENGLTTDGEALPRDTDPFYDYDYGYLAANDFEVPLYASPTQRNVTRPAPDDESISAAIMQELRWEPAIDVDTIDVAVRDGVAELSGSVPSRRLSRIAMANAYEGGAYEVDVTGLVVD